MGVALDRCASARVPFQLLEDLGDELSLLEANLFVIHIREICRILDQRPFLVGHVENSQRREHPVASHTASHFTFLSFRILPELFGTCYRRKFKGVDRRSIDCRNQSLSFAGARQRRIIRTHIYQKKSASRPLQF